MVLNSVIFVSPEREENVKVDIFHAYIALLRQTRPSVTAVALDSESMEHEEG